MISLFWRQIGRISLALFLALIIGLPHAFAVGDADFFLTPSKSSVSVGERFSVRVTLSSVEPIDTIRLQAAFNPSLFEGLAVTTGSDLPSASPGNDIDNTTGKISWGAFTLGDAASGSSLVATMTFKALKSGQGTVSLLSSSLALEDGNNLYSGGGVSVPIDIKSATGTVENLDGNPIIPNDGNVVVVPQGAVTISSSSHPDSGVWYAKRDVVFSWNITGDKPQEFWFTFDENPDSDPSALSSRDSYSPDLPSATYNASSDGIWYLHARVVYKGGSLSSVIHIPVKIDTTPPESLGVDIERIRLVAGDSVVVNFGARENLSGVTYAVSINGGPYEDAISPYELKNIRVGDTLFAVRATDGAGNTVFANTRLRAYDANAPFARLFTHTKTLFENPRNTLFFIAIIGAGFVSICGILFLFARSVRKRNKVRLF